MRRAVSNSVAIIHLFKAGEERVLKYFFERIFISPKVHDETVIAGKEHGYADAFHIEEAISDFIEVKALKTDAKQFANKLVSSGIEQGEAETIALAKQLKCPAILDEKNARRAAEHTGIEYLGTLGLIHQSYREELITLQDAKSAVKKLIESGYRISPELYIRFEESIEELDR